MAAKRALKSVLFDSTNPRDCNAQFKSKGIACSLCVFAAFASFVFLTSWMVWFFSLGLVVMLIADAIAFVGAYFLYTLWVKRPILIQCTGCECEKIISSSTPWVCKACGAKNLDTVNFPFVNKCENCGISPKAYKCHHAGCEEMIFFTADEDATNYAHCLNSPKEVPATEKKAEILKKLKASKEEKIARQDIDEIKARTAELRKQAKPEKKKSEKEIVTEKIQANFELDELEETLKADLTKKYKGAELKRKLAVVAKEFRRTIIE